MKSRMPPASQRELLFKRKRTMADIPIDRLLFAQRGNLTMPATNPDRLLCVLASSEGWSDFGSGEFRVTTCRKWNDGAPMRQCISHQLSDGLTDSRYSPAGVRE